MSGTYATPHHTQSVLPKVTNLMLDQGIAEVGRLLGFIWLGRGGWGRVEEGGAGWRKVGQGGGRWGRVEEGGAGWRKVGQR